MHSFISIKLQVKAVLGAQQLRFDLTKLNESIHDFPIARKGKIKKMKWWVTYTEVGNGPTLKALLIN